MKSHCYITEVVYQSSLLPHNFKSQQNIKRPVIHFLVQAQLETRSGSVGKRSKWIRDNFNWPKVVDDKEDFKEELIGLRADNSA